MKMTECIQGRRFGRDEGFTLIELLVSIGILTVVLAATFTFLWGASKYWRKGQSNADVTENARMGLNRMTREMQQASVVTDAGTTQVSFTVDFGTGTGPETITYGFAPGTGGAAGTVWRSSNIGPQNVTLVNGVVSVQFDYYGNDYRCDLNPLDPGLVTWTELQACSTTPAAKIARVDITLNLSSGTSSQQTFVGQSWLRNRNASA